MTQIAEVQNTELNEYEQKSESLARSGVTPEILLHAEMIFRFAPYAHSDDYPMTKSDCLFVAIRCREMGVHPLNSQGIQVYNDNHGIHIDYHYSMIIKYASQLRKVRHTQPRYTRLTPEQLEDEGLGATDIAYHATFIPYEALDDYYKMMDKMTPQEAYDLFAIRGIGSVSKNKWGGSYFAPNGRSRAWKVQKRALKDAYVRWLGYPSPSEARYMQEQTGWVEPTEAALETYAATEDGENVIILAEHAAKQSNYIEEHPATQADKDAAKEALFGGGPPRQVVDAEPVTLTVEEEVDDGPPIIAVEGEWSDEAEAAAIAELQAEADAGKPGTPATARPHWTSKAAAIAWGIEQGAFGDPDASAASPHARNAFEKLKTEHNPADFATMSDLWYADVMLRLDQIGQA